MQTNLERSSLYIAVVTVLSTYILYSGFFDIICGFSLINLLFFEVTTPIDSQFIVSRRRYPLTMSGVRWLTISN